MELPAYDGSPAGPGYMKVGLSEMLDHTRALDRPTAEVGRTVWKLAGYPLGYALDIPITGAYQLDWYLGYLWYQCVRKLANSVIRVSTLNNKYVTCYVVFERLDQNNAADARRAAALCHWEPTLGPWLSAEEMPPSADEELSGWLPNELARVRVPNELLRWAPPDQSAVRPGPATGEGMRNTPAVPWAYVRSSGLADLGRDLEDIYQHEFQPDVANLARAITDTESFWEGGAGHAYRRKMIEEVVVLGDLYRLLLRLKGPCDRLDRVLVKARDEMRVAITGLDSLYLDREALGYKNAIATITVDEFRATCEPIDWETHERFRQDPRTYADLRDLTQLALNAARDAVVGREEFEREMNVLIGQVDYYQVPQDVHQPIVEPPLASSYSAHP